MTTQSPPKLYDAREPIFPRRVSGYFRRLKWWIMAVTLGIYYLTPWLRWDRGEALPDGMKLMKDVMVVKGAVQPDDPRHPKRSEHCCLRCHRNQRPGIQTLFHHAIEPEGHRQNQRDDRHHTEPE